MNISFCKLGEECEQCLLYEAHAQTAHTEQTGDQIVPAIEECIEDPKGTNDDEVLETMNRSMECPESTVDGNDASGATTKAIQFIPLTCKRS